MLNERGIQAITPSCLNTPSGPNFSPTVTPCNSPEGGSPIHHHHHAEPVSITSFLTSRAGLLKKKFTGAHSSRMTDENKAAIILEKKAKFRSIKILENVHSLGIDNILSTTSPSTSQIINKPLALNSSNIYTRYNSPMLQLTSLKHLSEKTRSSENASDVSDKASSTLSAVNSANISNKETQEARMKHKMQRQKTRRNINAIQRPDLGTVNGTKARENDSHKQGIVGGFVGSISSIFFGRKGGFL